jgi:hypothetical protein
LCSGVSHVPFPREVQVRVGHFGSHDNDMAIPTTLSEVNMKEELCFNGVLMILGCPQTCAKLLLVSLIQRISTYDGWGIYFHGIRCPLWQTGTLFESMVQKPEDFSSAPEFYGASLKYWRIDCLYVLHLSRLQYHVS